MKREKGKRKMIPTRVRLDNKFLGQARVFEESDLTKRSMCRACEEPPPPAIILPNMEPVRVTTEVAEKKNVSPYGSSWLWIKWPKHAFPFKQFSLDT